MCSAMYISMQLIPLICADQMRCSFLSSRMAYHELLADRIRAYLLQFPELQIEEKKMFSGLAFLVNDKMCVNVSGDNLMCRFDPARHDEIAEQPGFLMMVMRGKELKGYCYVEPMGFSTKKSFAFWMELCLEYNQHAKASRKNKK